MSQIEKGSCLCGQCHYEFDRAQVLSAHHCHCRDCQKTTGSGKATILFIPTAAVALEGELKTYTVTGTDGSHVTRGFCPHCGSGVLSKIEELPDVRLIKAGTLEDGSWVSVDSSFWRSTAAPWSPVDELSLIHI